ncbi:MAG TPA: DUF4292 domain-containing protein [Flavobacteriales bacterium]|nr:DUF4292 domain-containing protein [Flavobacteriales bacterium]
MWNKQESYVTACLLVMVFLYACTGQHHLATGKPNHHLNTNKIIDSVELQKLSFADFTSRLSVDVESKSLNESFTAHVKIRKDSIMWIDIRKAGLAVARVLITKDSLKMIMRMGQGEGYYPRSFNFLNEQFDTELDFTMLQDLITANPMSFDPQEKYKSPKDSAYYYLTTLRKRRLRKALEHDRVYKKHDVIYQYKFYPKTFKPYQVWINDINDTTVFDARYLEYEGLDSIPLPKVLEIEASKADRKMKLKLEYKRTRLNEKTDFPFVVPDDYERK